MRKILVPLALVTFAIAGPAVAEHDASHDPRPNPNCAWDSSKSVDWDNDGEPDHMVAGVSHNTSFPRQFVEKVWEPVTGQDQLPPFFGGHDGPDDVSVTIQGDHRMLGANPAHTDDGDPEQQHNGAITARVDYEEIEDGREPTVEAGFGIYEANHLVMACRDADGHTQVAACLAGNEILNESDVECPVD